MGYRLPWSVITGEGPIPGASDAIPWRTHSAKMGRIRSRTSADRVQRLYDTRDRSRGEDWRSMICASDRTHPLRPRRGAWPWYLCPARGCGRRVAKIYGGVFACRKCHDVTYPSCRRNDEDRATDMAQDQRQKLGWPGGLHDEDDWGRPKGMHRKTYARHLARYRRSETRAVKRHALHAEEFRAMGNDME